jgi:hypothetical protein
MERARRAQVLGSTRDDVGVVSQGTDAEVAAVTEQTPHVTRAMVVVYGREAVTPVEQVTETDRARAALALPHRGVLLDGDRVLVPQLKATSPVALAGFAA